MSEQALHLFRGPESRLGHGEEVVSAFSTADAWEVWQEFCGETKADYPKHTWSQMPDEQPFTIYISDPEDADPRDLPLPEDCRVTHPAREWAARGRGIVAGENY